MLLLVPVTEIIRALEGEAGNTDTDPRWLAASELRRLGGWERRTLMCDVDTNPTSEASAPVTPIGAAHQHGARAEPAMPQGRPDELDNLVQRMASPRLVR